MAPATPAINEALVQARVPEAKHGQKGALVAQLCSATGKSRATVYRQLQIATVRPQRRKRSLILFGPPDGFIQFFGARRLRIGLCLAPAVGQFQGRQCPAGVLPQRPGPRRAKHARQ